MWKTLSLSPILIHFYVVVYKMLMGMFLRSELNFVGSGQGKGFSEKSCVSGSHLSTPFKDLKLPRADKSADKSSPVTGTT